MLSLGCNVQVEVVEAVLEVLIRSERSLGLIILAITQYTLSSPGGAQHPPRHDFLSLGRLRAP